MSQTIGFIGLGKMGLPMAKNLIAAGYALRAYNRTAEKARGLAGATAVDTPAQTASPGGIVVSVLSDDAALESAAGEELIQALSPGGIHVSMSTVSSDVNARLAELGQKHDVHVVAAPVFGRPDAAAARKLWICISGDPAAKQRVRPVLNAMSQGVFDFGESVGAANVVKVMGNFLIMAAIEAMAEASAVAEKHGIPRQDLLAMFTSTLFNCPIYNLYSKKIVDADYDNVGFKAVLALKDMRLAREASVSGRAPAPTIDLICQRFLSAVANGRGELDASSFANEAALQAGLNWQKR